MLYSQHIIEFWPMKNNGKNDKICLKSEQFLAIKTIFSGKFFKVYMRVRSRSDDWSSSLAFSGQSSKSARCCEYLFHCRTYKKLLTQVGWGIVLWVCKRPRWNRASRPIGAPSWSQDSYQGRLRIHSNVLEILFYCYYYVFRVRWREFDLQFQSALNFFSPDR